MLLTRESDYALRVLRSLRDGERRSVGDISLQQLIPQQFAYKIIKKRSRAGPVEITRGVDGGAALASRPRLSALPRAPLSRLRLTPGSVLASSMGADKAAELEMLADAIVESVQS